MKENFLDFDLMISKEEYLKYYKGSVKYVIVETHGLKTIKFPANILQSFVSHNGISGHFRIYFSSDQRFLRLERK